MSENRVIGNAGDIPWHLPDDFKWFKKTTMGDVLIMGRKTYESIGRPLPGRETIVISRQPQAIPGVQCLDRLSELENLPKEKTLWVAGGGEIYRQLLPKCTEIYLTRVHQTVEGDAFFPAFEDQFEKIANVQSNDTFTIEHWKRSSA